MHSATEDSVLALILPYELGEAADSFSIELDQFQGKHWMFQAKNAIKLTVAVALTCCGISPVIADTPYFAVFGVGKQSTSISDSKFDNYSLAVQAGRWIAPGVGLQLSANIPANDDTVGSVNLSLDGLYTAGLKLEGPMAFNNGTAAFVAVGFASAKIDAASNFAETSDWYHGYFTSVGLSIGIGKRSQFSLEYSYHAVDTTVRIPAVQLGYRFQF